MVEPVAMAATPPSTIGRYEIRKELGRGTMGVVYEARDPLLERTVALKTIGLSFAVDPAQLEVFEKRFFAEARIAARLSHRNIVVVHDVGRDAETGTLFIALEYLVGQTLSSILKSGKALEWRRALEIQRAVADALDHAHGQRVVHRDVKPANIMILPSGDPKLMDFGIARIETARLKLTQAGDFFGTPLYMSPEQALGRPVDGRSDLFSLGAIAYEMFTGQRAFAAETVARIIGRVLKDDPVPPSSLVPGLPSELDYVTARLLAKRPADRYPSGRIFSEDVGDILSGPPPRHKPGWAATGGLDLDQPSVADAAHSSPSSRSDGMPTHSLDELEGDLAELVSARPPAAEPNPSLAAASPAIQSPAAPRPPTHRRALLPWLATSVMIAAAVVALVLARQRGPLQPQPGSSSTLTGPPPLAGSPQQADGEGTRPTGKASSARLAIDFEHPLKDGHLKVWVDDDLVLDRAVDSRVTRKIVVFERRKGSVDEEIEVSAGRHRVKVEVAWDDNVRTETITATFRPTATRRLAARLGGVIKKDLTLEWE